MSRKTYLVTGCAGFIAAQVATQLLDAGHVVVGIDNINDYYSVDLKRWRLAALVAYPDFTFMEADVGDLVTVKALFEKYPFAAVLNLAARAGVRASMADPFVYQETNALGMLNILEAMRLHGVGKIVQASTSSLYAGRTPPFRESDPVDTPISPYAASKRAAEIMAYTYHHLYGIDVSIVRYFTVYGPAGRPDMSPFRFIKWIHEGTPLTIYGDGTQSRDFTYVDDIARGTILALKPVGYDIFNLGGGRRPATLLDLIGLIEKKLGRQAVLKFELFHQADMANTAAVIDKARDTLGWEPQVDLVEGVDRTVQWYLDNLAWAQKLPV
jgi:UDP-glucuronate 4-epimerase